MHNVGIECECMLMNECIGGCGRVFDADSFHLKALIRCISSIFREIQSFFEPK